MESSAHDAIARHAFQPLAPDELTATSGGDSPIGRLVGYMVGFAWGLIVHADPFDGNYYGVGA